MVVNLLTTSNLAHHPRAHYPHGIHATAARHTLHATRYTETTISLYLCIYVCVCVLILILT